MLVTKLTAVFHASAGRHLGGGVVEVQRQLALHQLEGEQDQEADRRERQHAAGVGAPALLGLGVGADERGR